MAQAVASSAVVALIIQGVLMTASLTSNSGSWTCFLSRLSPLPVAYCNDFFIVIQNITPNKFGHILVLLRTAYREPSVALVLLS